MSDSATADAPPSRSGPTITRGTAYALFAYDLGFGIRLEAAERLLAGPKQRGLIKPSRRIPPQINFQVPPLRVTQPAGPVQLGSYRTTPAVEAILYDFGSVSIAYSIPIQGPLFALRDLSNELYDHDVLRADSRRRVEQLLAELRPFVSKPSIAPFLEDYTIFHVAELSQPCDHEELLKNHPHAIAQVLRAEGLPLSAQEIADALSARTSYGAGDVTLIDWNAALVFDTDGEDVRTVLEYANVELLEMRFLDRQLDAALEQAYSALARPRWWPMATFGSLGRDLRHIAGLQADSAMLFEGVNNALKLIGDQYLARVYRVASQRLRLPEWDASILRKLEMLESIYSKMADQQSSRRAELLEWIIILLIALEIAMPFIPPLLRK